MAVIARSARCASAPGGAHFEPCDKRALGQLKREVHQICAQPNIVEVQSKAEENKQILTLLVQKLQEMPHPFAGEPAGPGDHIKMHEFDGMHQSRSLARLQMQYVRRMRTFTHILEQNYLTMQSIPGLKSILSLARVFSQSSRESYSELLKMMQTSEEQYHARVVAILRVAPHMDAMVPSQVHSPIGGPQIDPGASLEDISHDISTSIKEMESMTHILKAQQHDEVALRWLRTYRDLENHHPFALRPAGPRDARIVSEIEELCRNLVLASLEKQYVHRMQTLRYIAVHHYSAAKTAIVAQNVLDALQTSRAIIESNYTDLIKKMKDNDREYDSKIQEFLKLMPRRRERDDPSWRLVDHQNRSDCILQ